MVMRHNIEIIPLSNIFSQVEFYFHCFFFLSCFVHAIRYLHILFLCNHKYPAATILHIFLPFLFLWKHQNLLNTTHFLSSHILQMKCLFLAIWIGRWKEFDNIWLTISAIQWDTRNYDKMGQENQEWTWKSQKNLQNAAKWQWRKIMIDE